MKILIAYGGKSGTSHRAAEDLKKELDCFDCTVVDLSAETPDLAAFDYTVLGGSIRFGRLHRAVKRFAKKQKSALCERPFSLFLCCAYEDFFDHYVRWGFGKELVARAENVLYFGGELDLSVQKGLDRFFVRRMRNDILFDEDGEAVLPGYLPEHVRLFAEELRKKYAGEKII